MPFSQPWFFQIKKSIYKCIALYNNVCYSVFYLLLPHNNVFYRINSILVKSPTSVRSLLGLIESWSMFQTLKNNDPQRAEDLLMKTQKRYHTHINTHTCTHRDTHRWLQNEIIKQKPYQLHRFLDEMGTTSLQTAIVYEFEYFCILASKPE